MATIIRKNSAGQTPSGRVAQPVAFSFADIHGQANDYMETVRGECAKVVQQAHAEAEKVRRQAEAAGRKAAEAAIERVLDEKVARRMDTLLPALEQLVYQINDAKGELLAQWARCAVKVATSISERVIRRQLDRHPQITLEVVAEALRLASGSAEITLRLNPTDYENLGPQVERLGATLCRLVPAQIVADAEITLGGCRVETKFGAIDNQIEAQMRRIEEELS